jgi:FixJ family two-component response regulator
MIPVMVSGVMPSNFCNELSGRKHHCLAKLLMNSLSEIESRGTVLVVDNDSDLLRAMERLIRSAKLSSRTFDAPRHLLTAEVPKSNVCLLLDVYMPEMSGVELYEILAASGRKLPVIMITGRDDVETRRLLQRVNAIAVLFKPLDGNLLLDAIARALACNRQS